MSTLYQRLLASNIFPWRMRNALEQWVETRCYALLPGMYRRLHFGRGRDRLTALTQGPKHHFYGYYDKSPWNASGKYILAHESEFNDRAPNAEDSVSVGLIDVSGQPRFTPLARSLAWNWQQGSMAQWHPGDAEHRFAHNDRRGGQLVGVVRNTEGAELRVYDRPIYAMLPDGHYAYSINFARLAEHRPGYGYAGAVDPWASDPQPAHDGLWRIDLESGRAELLISLAELAARNSKPSMAGAFHYLNHVQPSRNGKRLAFFHIWHRDTKSWEVRLYSCAADGGDLRCLLDTGSISHYDWRDDDTILIWARHPSGKSNFLLLSHSNPEIRVFGGNTLIEDGHCTFSPDKIWVLNDTYPDRYQKRTLMIVQAQDARRIDVARLESPKARWWGEIRCDLHPRWSRDGRQVCIDSVHDGSRQMYVVDVGDMTA